MKSKKISSHQRHLAPGSEVQTKRMETERNPELIEKFYKQIINSFGYAYPAKI